MDSYLLALGHLPIMGIKERQKKMKRAEQARAELAATPKAAAAKRPASARSAPSAPSKPNEPNEPNKSNKPNKPTEPCSEPPEPPSFAAGSGNPASSGSSGGVEAERASARAGWAYDEGVEGKYTCAQCGVRPLRSQFLIEATDLEGNLCVGYDLEGRLWGRCYGCCRGRGKYKGPEDIYADLVDTHDEETLANIFRMGVQ